MHQVASKQKTNDTSVWGKAPCHMNANEKTLLYLVHRSIHCYQIYYILQYYLLLWMSHFFTNQFIWCGVSRCSGGLGKTALCICSIICRAETILQIVKWLNLICERYDAYARWGTIYIDKFTFMCRINQRKMAKLSCCWSFQLSYHLHSRFYSLYLINSNEFERLLFVSKKKFFSSSKQLWCERNNHD